MIVIPIFHQSNAITEMDSMLESLGTPTFNPNTIGS